MKEGKKTSCNNNLDIKLYFRCILK